MRDIQIGDSFKLVPQSSEYHIKPFSEKEWNMFLEADADEAKEWIKERIWKVHQLPTFQVIEE